MIDIIKHICESIYNDNIQWDNYFYLGKKDKKGRIFGKSDVNMRDYDYMGLTDLKGNYFYIRHKDDEIITYSDVPGKDSCSKLHRASAECRLVASLNNYANKYNLEKVLINELASVDYSTYTGDEQSIEVVISQSFLNPTTIIAEESNGVSKSYPHTLDMVAIDFTLLYNTDFNDCMNLNCGSTIYHEGSVS